MIRKNKGAIAKLEPNAAMGDGLTIEYDGGSSIPSKVRKWLKKNGIKKADRKDIFMAKGNKANTIKSISLRIGNKKVTKKTYKMKQGEKKKLKVAVLPKNG